MVVLVRLCFCPTAVCMRPLQNGAPSLWHSYSSVFFDTVNVNFVTFVPLGSSEFKTVKPRIPEGGQNRRRYYLEILRHF